jgi:3-deoxy-D-manno-octulosonate 8-phosphate phosphatase (KDO 8-P phosphatase)
MDVDFNQITTLFKGQFLIEPADIQKRLAAVRALIFDWDGVFNNGIKNENGSSAFSEVDAMGTNLLRFCHYLHSKNPPFTAIISGEKNELAFSFARREHFNEVYYGIRHKREAVHHICKFHNLDPGQIAFIFDDVLDFSAAEICGLRIMVGRTGNPLLIEFAKQNHLADYITEADGGHYAVRETTELLMALSGSFAQAIGERMRFSDEYKNYWQLRNLTGPVFYTSKDAVTIEKTIL